MSLVSSIDLRGDRVAAVLSDVYSYAYSARVDGSGLRSMRVASSEGESDEHAVGLALGAGDALWSLTTSLHVGDPLQTVINRRRGRCRAIQVLTAASPTSATLPSTSRSTSTAGGCCSSSPAPASSRTRSRPGAHACDAAQRPVRSPRPPRRAEWFRP